MMARRLILLLLFIPLVFSCSDGETTTITISDPDPLDTSPMNCIPLVIQVTYD